MTELYFFLSKDKSARVPYVDLILENVFRFLACNRWLGGTVHPPLEGSGNSMRAIFFLQHIFSNHELTIFIFHGTSLKIYRKKYVLENDIKYDISKNTSYIHL